MEALRGRDVPTTRRQDITQEVGFLMKGRIAVLAATVAVLLLLITAVSVASSTFTPKLGFPNGHRVHTGKITLKVKAPFSHSVFAQIEPGKKMSKGFLKNCDNVRRGCDFIGFKRWRGHKGWWIYHAPSESFGGWWTTTPGTYHWQARSYADSPPCSFSHSTCIFNSRVGSFKVVR
jgi:hypothetical protein